MKSTVLKSVMNAIFSQEVSRMYKYEGLENEKAPKQCEVYIE